MKTEDKTRLKLVGEAVKRPTVKEKELEGFPASTSYVLHVKLVS